MTETQSAEALPPHFRCDCVPSLGPAHCHRCSSIASAESGAAGETVVQWDDAPCKELVEGYAYRYLLTYSRLVRDFKEVLEVISQDFDWRMGAMVQPPSTEITESAVTSAVAPRPVPAPPKTRLTSALDRPGLASVQAYVPGERIFTRLARGQVAEMGRSEAEILALLDGPHIETEARSGSATNHYCDGLLIMVDGNGTHIISVIDGDVPRPTTRSKAHHGGSGRRMPSRANEILAMLRNHGFTTVRGGGGHYLATHPHHPGARFTIASSPSDSRSYRNIVAEIKRSTDIDITTKKG